jgi:hypothetical protein
MWWRGARIDIFAAGGYDITMNLWALLPRITAAGIEAEWCLVQLRSESDLPNAVQTVLDAGAMIMELREGDKLLEGLIAPSVASPILFA